jgi:hypothetical protein
MVYKSAPGYPEGEIDFPAVVIGELELNGYVIERVCEHAGRSASARWTEAPNPPASRQRHRWRRVSRRCRRPGASSVMVDVDGQSRPSSIAIPWLPPMQRLTSPSL